MPLHITHRDIEEAHRYARDAMTRMNGAVSEFRVERATKAIFKGAEVAAGAAAVGFLSGYRGDLDVKLGNTRIPCDLLAGLAGHAAGLFFMNEATAEHLHNFSDGVLAAFVTKYMVGLGRSKAEAKAAGGASAPSSIAGTVTKMLAGAAPAAAPLTERELATIAQGIR